MIGRMTRICSAVRRLVTGSEAFVQQISQGRGIESVPLRRRTSYLWYHATFKNLCRDTNPVCDGVKQPLSLQFCQGKISFPL